ncbi:MAG: hypothetical protein IPM98_19185 [Lewinellaceae bacterium]|nr:hypothetical protein [Lewinellaceae bacterium]
MTRKGNLGEFVREQQAVERILVGLEKQKTVLQQNQIGSAPRRARAAALADVAMRRTEMRGL